MWLQIRASGNVSLVLDNKLLLIIVATIVSVIAQANLKVTSPFLPTSLATASELGFVRGGYLVLRAGFFSGLSLLMTWYCYRKFGFLELILVQSLIYVAAVFVSHYYFQEPLTLNKLGAIFFIMVGVGLLYVK